MKKYFAYYNQYKNGIDIAFDDNVLLFISCAESEKNLIHINAQRVRIPLTSFKRAVNNSSFFPSNTSFFNSCIRNRKWLIRWILEYWFYLWVYYSKRLRTIYTLYFIVKSLSSSINFWLLILLARGK